MQAQLRECSESMWVELTPTLNQITDRYTQEDSLVLIKSGIVSDDGQ